MFVDRSRGLAVDNCGGDTHSVCARQTQLDHDFARGHLVDTYNLVSSKDLALCFNLEPFVPSQPYTTGHIGLDSYAIVSSVKEGNEKNWEAEDDLARRV